MGEEMNVAYIKSAFEFHTEAGTWRDACVRTAITMYDNATIDNATNVRISSDLVGNAFTRSLPAHLEAVRKYAFDADVFVFDATRNYLYWQPITALAREIFIALVAYCMYHRIN